MNRSDIRTSVKLLLNWEVFGQDTAFLDRINRCIDMAYARVGNDCPEALVPDEVRMNLPGTVSSGSGAAVTSYISSTSDPFVMEFTSSAGSSWAPITDRTWDGLMWIEITLADGTLARYQCREFWTAIDGGVNHKYVTLDRPWTLGVVANLKYRLHAPYLWLRDDVERVVIGQRFGSTGNPLSVSNLAGGIYHGEWSNQNDRQFGYPNELRPENHYQHPSPNIAPIPTVNDQGGNWGPEPYGQFTYLITYCWGYRDGQRKSASGGFIPLFESTPSPASSAVTISGAGQTVTLTTPEIAWQLNYGDNLTLRYGKSGWFKRVYRARVTTGVGPSHTTIEYPNVYQYLFDIEDTVTSSVDNGSVIPDYTIRLPETHGYRGWSMWPLPTNDTMTEYQLKIQKKPGKLYNDYDAPAIVPSCIDALTFYGCAYLARHDKDVETAELYEAKAKEVLAQYRSRIANPTGVVRRETWDGATLPRGGWPRATAGS